LRYTQLSNIFYFILFRFASSLFLNSTMDPLVKYYIYIVSFLPLVSLGDMQLTGFIVVYLDIIRFVKIISSFLTQKYCNRTGKPIVQHTVSDFVPGFQWQLYVCLACVTAIAGPKHINCRKAISLVKLRGVINVLRTLVCTALNHSTSNYSRTPNKIVCLFECYEGRLKTGPHFHVLFEVQHEVPSISNAKLGREYNRGDASTKLTFCSFFISLPVHTKYFKSYETGFLCN
jgi:hypothetical protein